MAKGEVFNCLLEWAERYARYRDISRKIIEIKGADFGFEALNNDGTFSLWVISPSLKQFKEELVAGKKAIFVVSLSNNENIRYLEKEWDSFAANQGMVLIFVNPFSAAEEKWLVKPSLHNRVSEKASLLQGLRAMAELVEPIDEAALAARLRTLSSWRMMLLFRHIRYEV